MDKVEYALSDKERMQRYMMALEAILRTSPANTTAYAIAYQAIDRETKIYGQG